ncbi:MAG: HNH endonuclease [Planctomycetes bacterium]|nr:HNH endonuclease [Planctomycetota bacterium]
MPEEKPLFRLKRMSDRSPEAILTEFRRVAELIPDVPLTQALLKKHGRVSPHAVVRHFGGWKQALEAAGLADRYSGIEITEKHRTQFARTATDEQLLNEIRAVAAKLGKQYVTITEFEEHSKTSRVAIENRFGSYRKALALAGLKRHHAKHSESELFENLMAVWVAMGREPYYQEMRQPPSVISGKSYVRTYGSWLKAKEAFVAFANHEDSQSIPPQPDQVSEPAVGTKEREKPEDRQSIPLGLRWKVYLRDRFRCTACGASPATSLECKLHVDHVLPFSKRGKTVFENLRTLCEKCNLGRGNTTDDLGAS